MNIHHLELFYYVARHGGITEAVRKIPYGIQQPAVSGQVAQLEEFLGVTLFHRRPFALTPQGERLYQFIEPFFANLDSMTSELQGNQERLIRIGAATTVLRDHLPEVCRRVRKKYPSLKITLREGYQAELESLLQQEQLDLIVTVVEDKPAPGIHVTGLVELPLALLLPQDSPISAPEQLWRRDRIEEPLICLPDFEPICKHFQRGLGRLGVDWFPSIVVSSMDLIEAYVASGFGIGITVHVPQATPTPSVRRLVLPEKDFASVAVGALWRGKPSALLQAFLDESSLRAKRFS